MNKLGVVIGETYKRNIKSVSFIIMILMPFIFLGIGLLFGKFATGFSSKTEIAIVATTDSQEIRTSLISKLQGFEVDKKITSEAAAQKALQNEDIGGYLKISVTDYQLQGEYYSSETMGTANESELNQSMNQIQALLTATKLKLTPEQLQSLSTPASMKINKVSFDKDDKMLKDKDNSSVMRVLAMIIVILMFFIIYTYAAIAAQEIASEKGTRIMEVILSSTNAATHFYGKLIAIFLVSLTQIFVYIFAFILFAVLSKRFFDISQFIKELPTANILVPFLTYVMAYFLLGVLIYTALAALCGSLVSKSEDTPKAITPIVYLSMIGYMVGLVFGMSDPQNLILKICSYIPFLSSTTMPVRLAYGTATGTEVLISLVILAVSTVLVILFSAKLYKTNVLVYSDGGLFKSLKRSLLLLKAEKQDNSASN